MNHLLTPTTRPCLILAQSILLNSAKPTKTLTSLSKLYSNCQILRIPNRFVTTSSNSNELTRNQSSRLASLRPGDRLIYEGKFNKRIRWLKTVSIFQSGFMALGFKWLLDVKGTTIPMIIAGALITPYLLSPFAIAFFFKRYTTYLYYNSQDDTYTIQHYGLWLDQVTTVFKIEDVEISNNFIHDFKVLGKPFYLTETDFRDIESLKLYKRMLGYDRNQEIETNNDDGIRSQNSEEKL